MNDTDIAVLKQMYMMYHMWENRSSLCWTPVSLVFQNMLQYNRELFNQIFEISDEKIWVHDWDAFGRAVDALSI